MKQKSRACSTGHGTGDGPYPGAFMNGAPLGLVLERGRLRRLVKKYGRRYKKATRIAERSYDDYKDFVLALLRGDEAAAKRAGYARRAAA